MWGLEDREHLVQPWPFGKPEIQLLIILFVKLNHNIVQKAHVSSLLLFYVQYSLEEHLEYFWFQYGILSLLRAVVNMKHGLNRWMIFVQHVLPPRPNLFPDCITKCNRKTSLCASRASFPQFLTSQKLWYRPPWDSMYLFCIFKPYLKLKKWARYFSSISNAAVTRLSHREYRLKKKSILFLWWNCPSQFKFNSL